jgi:hypothetical protein
MKLAYASSAFDRAIKRGDLTQIEFVELCARELAADGIVLDIRHFPRTDDDYLAQIKKMTTDLGLGIAALQDDTFLTADGAMQAALRVALAIATPLIAAPLAAETSGPWSEQLARLNVATGLAKAANVTLALRNAPGTFAATVHDLKRASKEADSAWLRFGPEPALFAGDEDLSGIAGNVVLVWAADAAGTSAAAHFANYRGYVVVQPHEASAVRGI